MLPAAVVIGALRVNIMIKLLHSNTIYYIYPKYWEILTPYHTCSNILLRSLKLLDWVQTV